MAIIGQTGSRSVRLSYSEYFGQEVEHHQPQHQSGGQRQRQVQPVTALYSRVAAYERRGRGRQCEKKYEHAPILSPCRLILQICRNFSYNCIYGRTVGTVPERYETPGHSLTRARLAVFRALQDKEPLAMAEVARACAGKADRASVYRAVALFEELGIVKRLQIGWKYKLELSDAFHHHHHHLTCLKCGRVDTLARRQDSSKNAAGCWPAARTSG